MIRNLEAGLNNFVVYAAFAFGIQVENLVEGVDGQLAMPGMKTIFNFGSGLL